MFKRLTLVTAVVALALTVPAQVGAAPAATSDTPTITPLGYKSVDLGLTNDSNRVLRLKVVNGWTPSTGTVIDLYPGKTQEFYGREGDWDLHFDVSWCADQVGLGCADKLKAVVKVVNPILGYPRVHIDNSTHGFAALERFTFEKAYGHAAKRGVAKFKTLRQVDTDLKRFRMNFLYAAPPAG